MASHGSTAAPVTVLARLNGSTRRGARRHGRLGVAGIVAIASCLAAAAPSFAQTSQPGGVASLDIPCASPEAWPSPAASATPAASAATASPAACRGPDAVVEVEARDLAFDRSSIEVSSGRTTTIVLRNVGRVVHNLTVDDLGLQAIASPGGSAEGVVSDPPPGTYEFYCSVSGHRQAGMVGTLVVR